MYGSSLRSFANARRVCVRADEPSEKMCQFAIGVGIFLMTGKV